MNVHRTAIVGAMALLLTSGLAGMANPATAMQEELQKICIVYGQSTGTAADGGTEIATTGTDCYGGVAAYVRGATGGHASVRSNATLHEANQTINDYMAGKGTESSAQAQPTSIEVSTVVGYGCDGSNFTSTCWNFAVGSSTGCSSGSWHWATLTMDNRLSSWTAESNCSYGVLYDLPYESSGSSQATCYTCYSLGSMDNRASSLAIYP